MLDAFQAYLKNNFLLQPHFHFIVACSGGMDSVVLCELCRQSNLSFSIAHCNFGLRGAESDRDETFVQRLGDQYNVPVFVRRFDTQQYGDLKKLSVQEAARALRYQWFEELRRERNATYVLLAHHANDNLETVLMNLFRGTGLHGLTGMPDRVDAAHCLRPLLNNTRREIETFAKANDLNWVDDSSNALNKYTRNFFRNEIIPTIQRVYPQVQENVLHTIERLKKTEALYLLLVDGHLKKLLVEDGSEIKIPINKLLPYAGTSLLYEVFKKFGFGEKQLPDILKLAQSRSGSLVQNERYRIIKHRKWFIISPHQAAETGTFVIEVGTRNAKLPDRELRIETVKKEFVRLNTSPLTAQLDFKEITFPLIVRRWQPGDYFYPLGLGKKKKLARFFIDLKLSSTDKENVWVVESASRIVWVIGYRIDDRAKVTDGTKTILQLTTNLSSAGIAARPG